LTSISSIATVLRTASGSPIALLKGLQKRDLLRLPSRRDIILATLALMIPLVVRLIPEILMYPYPLGFDTMSLYIPSLTTLNKGLEIITWDLVNDRPFFFSLASLPYPFGEAPSIKLFTPIVHGVMGLTSYLYAREIFKNKGKALATSLLLTLYFIALRVSWDLLSNELGVALIFAVLIFLKKEGEGWGWSLSTMLVSLAIVFTHEGASLILFLVTIPTALNQLRGKDYGSWLKTAIAILIPLGVYIFRLYSLEVSIVSGAMGGWWYPSGTPLEVALSVIEFFLYCNLPLLPFAILGVWGEAKDPGLIAWLLGCGLASLLPVISPTLTFSYWQRWTMMIVYPLAFFAVDGIDALKRIKIGMITSRFKSLELRLPVALIAIILFASLSTGFIFGTGENPHPYFNVYRTEKRWILYRIPATMQYNTLYKNEAEETHEAITLLNSEKVKDGCLIVDMTFRGYAALYLDLDKFLIYDVGARPYQNPDWYQELANIAEELSEKGFTVYKVGYRTIRPEFTEFYRGERIGLYKYRGEEI
jgi:hypothetical protein